MGGKSSQTQETNSNSGNTETYDVDNSVEDNRQYSDDGVENSHNTLDVDNSVEDNRQYNDDSTHVDTAQSVNDISSSNDDAVNIVGDSNVLDTSSYTQNTSTTSYRTDNYDQRDQSTHVDNSITDQREFYDQRDLRRYDRNAGANSIITDGNVHVEQLSDDVATEALTAQRATSAEAAATLRSISVDNTALLGRAIDDYTDGFESFNDVLGDAFTRLTQGFDNAYGETQDTFRNFAGNLTSNKAGGTGVGAATSGQIEQLGKAAAILGGVAAAYWIIKDRT